jgi:argininosuccinate lyase
MLHVLETVRALPSGYNRDFQETKRPVMDGIKTTLGSLNVFKLIIEGLGINEKACLEAFSSELFATDAALNLAASGVPFREAYRQIASTLSQVDMEDPIENILKKKHLGATGCLGLNLSESRIQVIQGWIDSEINKWSRLKQNLLQT